MIDNVDLRQQVLQSTLDEVASREHECSNELTDPCVICLEQVSEKAVAQPCQHDSFDFLCLVSWLQQRPACPLCKTNVISVRYHDDKIYHIDPTTKTPDQRYPNVRSRAPFDRRTIHRRPPPRRPLPSPSDALLRRKQVYRNRLYSLRVGSNRLSRFKELTPQEFTRDDDLVSRARKWIRRELQVFDFLGGEPNDSENSQARPQRRANNAEFLLEYIVAILKTVDVKGSGGQAEELLQEFLGRENTRLFLHEMQAWLRSPYNSLEDWDRAVQYDEAHTEHSESRRPWREVDSYKPKYWSGPSRNSARLPRVSHGGISKSPRSEALRHRQNQETDSFSRRLEAAQRRYEPD